MCWSTRRPGRDAVYQLLGTSDFILRPRPDLVFFRDPSVWVGDQVAVASPAAASRRLPAELAGITYSHHPLFAGTKTLYRPGLEPLHGGDLLLAAPGVITAAYSLTARVPTPGLDRLRVVETGFGPGRREQWDDAGNSLVLVPGLLVLHERNVATLARLERCGVEVIAVPGGELRGRRGGPRSLCCPVSRDPAPLPAGLCNEL